MAQSKWQKAHPEKVKNALALWRKRNPDRVKEQRKRAYAKNRIEAIEYAKAYWRARHPKKDVPSLEERKLRRALTKRNWRLSNPQKASEYRKKYRKKYAARVCAETILRKHSQRKAVPKWANKFFMEEAYDLAKRRTKITGYKWHVDHIIPLKSKLVCGLHVENNLRVIPAIQNLKKHNKVWPDMP